MASAEARSGRLRVLPRPAVHLGHGRHVWQVVRHPWTAIVAANALGVGILAVGVGLVYWPLMAGIGVYAESDTFTFFYPVYATLHAAIRDGELPLWTPYIYGGFPLFAEGQIGALYPPSIVAALTLSTVDGFLALRTFHVVVAVLGMFLFARVHGASAVGAAVGGLAFGLGSFMVGQQQHANMIATAAWLPLLLACLEISLRLQGWIGHGLVGLAALIVGLQALATHVQPLMLSGALMAAYVLARQTWMATRELMEQGPRAGARPATLILLDAGATLLFIAAIGALVAAIQLLPLYELSQESWRARGFSYQDAIEYSLPPINLLTLFFPFMFRGPDGGQWSLWQIWEGVLYVGIVPLVLAVMAAVAVRRWVVAFFAIAAVVSLVAALGGYAPFGLYDLLLKVPGMSIQRAPARFTLITTFSLAVLAAFGVDWLTSALYDQRRRHRRLFSLLIIGLLALQALLVLHLVIWRAWIASDRPWAMQVLSQTYLAQAHDALQMLDPLTVTIGLQNSLDLANPKTAFSLALLAAFAVLLLAWRELPRLREVWRLVLVGLVVADLAIFASDFHPLVDVSELGAIGKAGETLVDRADGWRVLTRPEVQALQPNELLPYGILEASGYSPLQLERQRGYASSVGTVDNDLLDLWSVRWIVEPAQPATLPSYRQVSYHPRRPLMIGGLGSPNGTLTLNANGEMATELRLISGLRDGASIPDGEAVAELTVTESSGVKSVYPLRAGREIAEWEPRQPGIAIAHRPIETAATITIDETNAQGTLGYTAILLPRRTEIARIDVRHVNRIGQTMLYGVGLFDAAEGNVEQLTREDRYREIFRDGEIAIYENPNAYPRTFVVSEAVVVSDGNAALARLRDGPVDPRRQVVVESQPTIGTGPFAAPPSNGAGIVAEGSSRVDIQASAPRGGFLVLTDAYYPGWRAYVDGEEVPILRADYLFRAVALSPGQHMVSFIFAPPSVRKGAELSAIGLVIAVGATLLGFTMPLLTRAGRRVIRSVRRRRRSGAAGADGQAEVPESR